MTRREMMAAMGAVGGIAGRLQADAYTPPPANVAARQWFQDARFGLFIHWGVYSVLGKGEWVMNNDKMSIAQYKALPPKFNPVKYNPAEWVALAKAAGMKYITITSKHHDGFAMWGTKLSKWNIVDATPYAKDVLKALSTECGKQGMPLFFYHSHLDWYQENYYPRGRTGHASGRPERGDFNKYLDYMDGQLTELLSGGYGKLAGIWFDGIWDKKDADWRLRKTYDLIHKLQPQALVGNNHHLAPFEGEDFQMFEKDLPGQNTTGFSGEAKIGALPLETCETINGAWGYNATDQRFKSRKQLIQYLVKAAGNNANFLLNVGPKPDGTIQPEFAERLTQIGQWLAKNGSSIYGTRGGPIGARPWGVTTQKKGKVYLHVLDWPDPLLVIPRLPAAPKKATLMGTSTPVAIKAVEGGHMVHLPAAGRDDVDTIIEVETA